MKVTSRSDIPAIRVVRGLSAALLALCAACGGGSSSTPTSPAPTTPVSSACGALGPSGSASIAIVNGVQCSTTNTPVVLLNLKEGTGQPIGSCSGTIIAPRAILTAAHCLPAGTASIKVFLGTGPEIVAKSFAPHPNYRESDNTTLDVGVVLMADDVGRTPMPVLLSRDARVGETAVIAGWGNDQNQTGATLRAGSALITVVSSLTLQTAYTTNASSVCQGDSGGPLLLSEGGGWAIGGIVSANSTLACSFGANFYANVRNADISSFILARVPDAARK
jgi:secreted trypsin-like serine protease